MGPRTILIDGYNVIRNTAGLVAAERLGLSAGRDALLSLLAARYRHTAHTVIVVFDGDGEVESMQPPARGVRGQVVFTRRGDSADAALQRIAAEARTRGADVVVVSNDLEVRLGASAVGGTPARADDLAARLHAPPKYHERQARHRAFVRHQLEGEQEEDVRHRRASGNPRRSPRKKRDAPDRGW
jgi:predicted RNA-binding protein with PIN domain